MDSRRSDCCLLRVQIKVTRCSDKVTRVQIEFTWQLASASVTPRHSPRVSVTVAWERPRQVASFERGSMMRAAIMARHSCRLGDGLAAIILSRPRLRMVPSTAATWPWGTVRTMSKFSGMAPEHFLSSARTTAITDGGSFDRLARVLFLVFPSSQ